MKFIISFLVVASSLVAFSQKREKPGLVKVPQPMAYLPLPLTARAYSVADRLQRLENQLNPAQLQMIEGSIARLESLLGVEQNHTPA